MNFNGEATHQIDALKRMTARMYARGPDDEGYLLIDEGWNSRAFYGDDTPTNEGLDAAIPGAPEGHIDGAAYLRSRVALGHRRLSILDLSIAGHQPMGTEDGRFWLAFNGEIYNFAEIAAELELDGISCRSHSDTEVLLRAYVHWGEDCLLKFNGMFAFAIWDNREKTLFCARDRIGIKPLYYVMVDGTFIFASDLKSIFASGLHSPQPDMQGLYLAMAFGIAPRPLTAFKGVCALEQAHWMRIGADGSVKKTRYWSIPTCVQINNMREGDAKELLEEQLIGSIRRRLVADVEVGTFMSGGVDSTTISAIAADLHPGIRAFTLAYEADASDHDEVAQAIATSRMHPMTHVVHRVKPEESLQDLQSWVDGYEEPYYSLAPNFVISKRVRADGIKVILNGLGGDELFAGYSWYRHTGTWKALRLTRPVSSLAPLFLKRGRSRLTSIVNASTADRLHTAFFAKSSDIDLRHLFRAPELRDINTPDLVHDLYCRGVEFQDPIEALSYMDLMNYIGNHHVHRSDQFTMMHSIEGRFPLLDHQLVEAAFTIPSHLKIRSGVQKRVLRSVAEQYIAPECLKMPKKGFGLPLKQWLRGPLRDLMNIKIEQLRQRPQIDSDTPVKWLRQYESGRRSANQVWHLVALELWFETFIDQQADISGMNE